MPEGTDWLDRTAAIHASTEGSAANPGDTCSTTGTEVSTDREQETGAQGAASRDTNEVRSSTATQLVQLASEATFWHGPDKEPYATFKVDGHHEHWPLHSRGFRSWLSRQFWLAVGRAASAQARQDALGILEGQAIHDGPEHEIHVRTAWHEGRIYLDLADDSWRAVEISADGWRVVSDSRVRFRRTAGMAPLPAPEPGGRLEALRELLGWPDDERWVAIVSWLVMALRPSGPYPVLILRGQQGTGKSTVARAIRALVDPSTVPVRTCPRSEQDLLIAARNGGIVAADNLSGVPVWLSDAICRLATGGGWSARQLYSDCDEVLIDACRPVMLTGIDLAPERQDLLDRATIVDVPTPAGRTTETEWWARYEQRHPYLIGALLDAVVAALRNFDAVVLDDPPRMADYAAWITAAEPAMGWSGRAVEVYRQQRRDAVRTALEGSPLADVLTRWMKGRHEWEGTASELAAALSTEAKSHERQSGSWPKSPAALTSQLERLAPGLKEAESIAFTRRRTHGGRRLLLLTRQPENGCKSPSPASPASESSPQTALCWDSYRDADGDVTSGDGVTAPDGGVTLGDAGGAAGDGGDAAEIASHHRLSPAMTRSAGHGDAGDDNIHPLSDGDDREVIDL